jgi:hypothetical protein
MAAGFEWLTAACLGQPALATCGDWSDSKSSHCSRHFSLLNGGPPPCGYSNPEAALLSHDGQHTGKL